MGGVVGSLAGPVLGAVGSIFGGGASSPGTAALTGAGSALGASASSGQISQGQLAAAQGANQQLAQTGQQVTQNVQPWLQAGQQSLAQYQNLLSGGAPNFNVANLPGYQFEQQQGQQAIQNSAASRGQALSGNTDQALMQFGQGMASTQFQQ